MQNTDAGFAIFGATGVIGQHVATRLLAEGRRCILFSARGKKVAVSRLYTHPIDLNVCQSETLAKKLQSLGVSHLVNCVAGWSTDIETARTQNVKTTKVLLDAAELMHPRPRFVQVSTVHEFGTTPTGSFINELTATHPESSYAASKLEATKLVLDRIGTGAMSGSVVRIANTMGPHVSERSFFGSLVARAVRSAADEHHRIPVAQAHRDYVDVRDAAAAISLAVKSADCPATLNIGRGVAVPVSELVLRIFAAAKVPASAVELVVSEVPSLGGDWTCVDARLARSVLGWEPRHSLESSLADAVVALSAS